VRHQLHPLKIHITHLLRLFDQEGLMAMIQRMINSRTRYSRNLLLKLQTPVELRNSHLRTRQHITRDMRAHTSLTIIGHQLMMSKSLSPLWLKL
jgi:hypothetical protein